MAAARGEPRRGGAVHLFGWTSQKLGWVRLVFREVGKLVSDWSKVALAGFGAGWRGLYSPFRQEDGGFGGEFA